MNDSLRILGLITHTGRGGARDAMLKLQREMKVRGHAFEVIFLYSPSQDDLNESDRSVVLPVREPSVVDYLRILPRLYKLIRNRHPDALIAFLPLPCVLGSIAGWLADRWGMSSLKSITELYRLYRPWEGKVHRKVYLDEVRSIMDNGAGENGLGDGGTPFEELPRRFLYGLARRPLAESRSADYDDD